MFFRRMLTLFAGILLASATLSAAPLSNVPQILIQPGGDTLYCFASGDEYYHWLHDADNYTIVQDPETGYFVYAILEGGRLVPSRFIAGTVDPRSAGIEPGVNVVPARAFELRKERNASIMSVSSPQQGVMNNLVVFIRFNGESEFPDSSVVYNRQHNDSTAGVNSMINYFREVSYNKLTVRSTMYPVPSGAMVTSYQDSHPRSYFRPYNATTNPDGYASDNEARLREHALLRDAVNAISSQVPAGINIDADNDGYVDNVCFIVSGSPDGWSDLLWPHMWALYTYNVSINGKRVYEYNLQLRSRLVPSGVGVLCHELSHTIGFPDLYRYVDHTIDPVSSWDLMCADRNPPQHVVAYQKMRYGTWIDSIPLITQTGVYALNPLVSSTNNCYRIASPYSPSEYFVVEYRKKEGRFENSVPGSGLLVYRINTAANGQGNANGPPDEVYIYRPGGTLTANGTPSYANFNEYVGRTRINDATSPTSFLSTGNPGGLDIRNIGIPGSTISFKVTMLEPLIELSRTTIPFGTIGLGFSRIDTLTMTNVGRESLFVSSITSGDGNFLVAPAGAVLAPAESRTVTVTYSPVATGVHAGSIVFTHNATGSQDTIAVSGVCEISTPIMTLSATLLSYGAVLVDSIRSDSVLVTNTGTGVMNVTSVTSDNPAFGVSPPSFSLQPSTARMITITFQPTAPTPFTGSILLVHDAPGSPDSIAVGGTGILPAPLFSMAQSTLNFDIVHVDSIKQDTVVISNTGNAPLTITSVISTNTRFLVVPGSDTIPPSGSSMFTVTFQPITGGPVSGAIVVTHDAAGSPDTVTVNGIGAQPEFSTVVQELSFDEVLVGSTKLKTLGISNPGYAPLVISSIFSDNDRFTVTPGSVTVAALAGRVFQVRFSPDSDKVESGNLIFLHDAAGSPDTVQLTGTGSIPHPVFTPSTSTLVFGNVDMDSPETDSILVTNSGTASLQISLAACDAGAFSVIPDNAVIAPSASALFAVTFNPLSMGNAGGNLIFSHNATGLADTIPLGGTGVRRIPMKARWNLVSVPVGLPGMMKELVFPTSTSSVFGWGVSGYAQADTLTTGPGYWAKFGLDQNVDMIGTPLASESLDVIDGWNMIGSVTNPVPAVSVTALGTTIISQIFRYSGGYSVADTIKPGRGYWVRVDQPGQVVLAATAPGGHSKVLDGYIFDAGRYSTVTITDANGNSQALYVDHVPDGEPSTPASTLPPPPPRGGFDASFTNRRMIERMGENGAADFLIHISDAAFPIVVGWNPVIAGSGSALFADASGSGGFQPVTKHERGSFSVNDPAVTNIRLSISPDGNLPASCKLYQNYPNPFNPGTVIRYEIPSVSGGTVYVTLKVYNILGQEVATLVDGLRGAGEWTARFDARNLPSGLYTYELRTGEARLAKTMMLIK